MREASADFVRELVKGGGALTAIPSVDQLWAVLNASLPVLPVLNNGLLFAVDFLNVQLATAFKAATIEGLIFAAFDTLPRGSEAEGDQPSGFAAPLAEISVLTEEIVATLTVKITGDIWEKCLGLVNLWNVDMNRNLADPSGLTKGSDHPDMILLLNNALVFKEEHKRTNAELPAAIDDLTRKMAAATSALMRGLTYLPCCAAAGSLLQFGILQRNKAQTAFEFVKLHEPLCMRTRSGMAQILRMTFNFMRLFDIMCRTMSETDPLFVRSIVRKSGCAVMVYRDYVHKVAPVHADFQMGVDDVLTRINHALKVAVKAQTLDDASSNVTGVELLITPVCTEVTPTTNNELRIAIHCVLTALAELHKAGFVHRDVRWPNVLHHPIEERWLLADFELSARVGAPLPERFRAAEHFSPEARGGGPCTAASDAWQVGRLILNAIEWIRLLSPEAQLLAERLAKELPSERLSIADALTDPWFTTRKAD